MRLSKEQILTADDLPKSEVQVPEWNGSVFVRMLTGSEKDKVEGYLRDKPYVHARAFVAMMSVCDESGSLLFGFEDLERLGGKSALALDKIFLAAQKLNTFTDEDVDALEKKSEAIPS